MSEILTCTGAFAMIDALGFKGIWERYPETEVIAALQELHDRVSGEAEAFTRIFLRPGRRGLLWTINATALSDTIVVAVAPNSLEELRKEREQTDTEAAPGLWMALKPKQPAQPPVETDDDMARHVVCVAAEKVREILSRAVLSRVPLLFRGAISYGRLAMSDRFIVGPAVDEAATFHERAHGAIVGLAPSASDLFASVSPWVHWSLVKYEIPTKSRGGWSTYGVVPWSQNASLEELAAENEALRVARASMNHELGRVGLTAFISGAMQTFALPERGAQSLREDVATKADNTVAFYRAAVAHDMLRLKHDLGTA